MSSSHLAHGAVDVVDIDEHLMRSPRIEGEVEVAVPRDMGVGDMGPDPTEHGSQRRALVRNEAVRQAQCLDEDEWFPKQANNRTVVSRRLARLQLEREGPDRAQPPDA